MKRPNLPDALDRTRDLRRLSTDAEKRLWAGLRNRRLDGWKFRRQTWIGPYVVDFVCIEGRLVIEADGGQHVQAAEYDDRRSSWLESEGFMVLRFWNNDVLSNTEGVQQTILAALRAPPHPPTAARRAPPSPPMGEGF